MVSSCGISINMTDPVFETFKTLKCLERISLNQVVIIQTFQLFLMITAALQSGKMLQNLLIFPLFFMMAYELISNKELKKTFSKKKW